MDSAAYVKWKEAFVLNDRGRKEVRYYLKRKDGGSDLAVVGKEKKLSYHYSIRHKALLSISPMSKLKSRNQVIHWLNSILSGSISHTHQSPQPVCGLLEVSSECQLNSEEDDQSWSVGKHATEFVWLGSANLKKKRKHYLSFQCNGVKISVHDFVYVLAEEDKPLVAYLDDMYEDSKGNKMVVVQWFHKIDEVGIALPENYNDREIFFSLCLQDLNIECVDGLASVLSPQHYEIFARENKRSRFEPFVCHRQFDNDDVKPFDITQVKGYSEQQIVKDIFNASTTNNVNNYNSTKDGPKEDVNCNNAFGINPQKRLRLSNNSEASFQPTNRGVALYACPKATDSSLKHKSGPEMWPLESNVAVAVASKEAIMQNPQALTIGAQVEVLSQDSGIRGCWFRALIIRKYKDKVKVRYLDIKDAADEMHNLEEWILTSRLAHSYEWCLRINGRPTVRPAPLSNEGNVALVIKDGSAVDVWWHDGWWEGIVIRKASEDNIHIYFPGEKRDSVFSYKDLRPSQEWLGTGWREIKERSDLVTSILSNIEQTVVNVKSCNKGSPLCRSSTCDDKVQLAFVEEESLLKRDNIDNTIGVRDIAKDDLLTKLRWQSSRKRKRSRSSSEKLFYSETKNKSSIKSLGTRTSEKFFIPSSVKVDHENCKYTRESAFSSSVVSPLSNLVLSR